MSEVLLPTDEETHRTAVHPPHKGFLALPAELREEIYARLLLQPLNTITMLSNFDCHASEVSARQPALCAVNRQVRAETLPGFYARNVFLAELSHRADLRTARNWLRAIGDANVRWLRRVALCGWTRVPFGHMPARRWVKVVLDLQAGTMELEEAAGAAGEAGRHALVAQRVEGLKWRFSEMVEARGGTAFDVEAVARLFEGFHALCTAY